MTFIINPYAVGSTPPVLWTPANLAVAPRLWVNGDNATFDGSNILTACNNAGSDGGSVTVGGSPTKATLNSLNGIEFNTDGEKATYTVGAWGTSNVQFAFVFCKFNSVTTDLSPFSRGAANPTSGLVLSVTDPSGFYYAAQGYSQAPRTQKTSGLTRITTPMSIAAANGSTQSLKTNGTVQTATNGAAGNFPNLGSGAYDVGQTWDGVTCMNGVVYQLMLFAYAPTAGEISQLEGWAHWKYAEQASLPGGHTYAGAAPTFP